MFPWISIDLITTSKKIYIYISSNYAFWIHTKTASVSMNQTKYAILSLSPKLETRIQLNCIKIASYKLYRTAECNFPFWWHIVVIIFRNLINWIFVNDVVWLRKLSTIRMVYRIKWSISNITFSVYTSKGHHTILF